MMKSCPKWLPIRVYSDVCPVLLFNYLYNAVYTVHLHTGLSFKWHKVFDRDLISAVIVGYKNIPWQLLTHLVL